MIDKTKDKGENEMQTVFIILFALSLFIGIPVSLILMVVSAIRKKPMKKSVTRLLVTFGLVVIGLIGGVATSSSKKTTEETSAEEKIVEKEEMVQNQEKETEESKELPEILFRGIPWGASYTEANSIVSDLNIWNISGENFQTMSTDEIVLGDYQGLDFEYSDINIVAPAYNGEIDVAGYTTSEINLYFSYIPVDGVLTKTEDDSAFYGGQYIFEPKNLDEMKKDLGLKITELYGEPSKTSDDTDIWGNVYTYTYWDGMNNVQVVLKTVDSTKDTTGFYTDEIILSYIWKDGDKLLQEASDTLKKEAIAKESEAYGDGSKEGL